MSTTRGDLEIRPREFTSNTTSFGQVGRPTDSDKTCEVNISN